MIRDNAFTALKDRFRDIIRLIAASRNVGDAAWRAAASRLDLRERPETGLGYGGASTSGSSRPQAIKNQVLTTAKEIVTLGESDPQIISLMGLFDEGVGPDTISDLTTNIILPQLCSLTAKFCEENGVRTRAFPRFSNASLPENPFRIDSPVILVPMDILRDLPLAADWSDVSRVVNEIEEIRNRFNAFLGPLAEATVTEKKRALRQAALASLESFRQLFSELLTSSDNYDPNEDILNYYAFRELISSDLSEFRNKIRPPTTPSRDELQRIVGEIIGHFRHLERAPNDLNRFTIHESAEV